VIEFMALGMPRSGTAWLANLLTTDTTLCEHDPMWRVHYSDLDSIFSDKHLGVPCTGLALFPEWVNAHPARKVILHRPFEEVDASLRAMGSEPLAAPWVGALDRIQGTHVSWKEIFDPHGARGIYEFLLEKPFDAERHAMLVGLNVQMDFERMKPDPVAVRRLFADLAAKGRQQ